MASGCDNQTPRPWRDLPLRGSSGCKDEHRRGVRRPTSAAFRTLTSSTGSVHSRRQPALGPAGEREVLVALDGIETIIFVMLENRSFDHALGYLSTAAPDPPLPVAGVRDDPPCLDAQ